MSFELNEPGYYKVKLFEEIEDFDKDQYGNTWYNVLFEGDAETFMWLKKDPPEEGKEYYGHIEKTKSGKRLRFKTDKLPEGTAPKSSPQKDKPYLKDVTDIPVRFMQSLLQYYDVQSLAKNPQQYENYIETVKLLTEDALLMIDNIRGAGDNPPSPPVKPELKEPKAATYQFRNRKPLEDNLTAGEPDLPEGLFDEAD